MNIKLNQKMIKELCGTVSFKRGESFYHANKVIFENDGPDGCKARVEGTESFHVSIEKDAMGGFSTACTCPTLASVKSDCQHIAAVLIAINEQQRKGANPDFRRDGSSTNQDLTEGLFTLFNHQPKRSSGQQLHFENRELLEAVFICKPVTIDMGQNMFGIEISVGPANVQNIRDFLARVNSGYPCALSAAFTYDPNRHCFLKETDAVIQQLVHVMHDEKVFVDSFPVKTNDETSREMLLIPPSSWEQLIPLLTKAPFVRIEHDGKTIDGFHLSNGKLPIQYDFSETKDRNYELKIKGLNQLTVLNAYSVVLAEGHLIQLEREESERLVELKQMLKASDADHIPIPRAQINYFLEKVVPELKKSGEVKLSDAISRKLLKTPLVAKLYLDRVKNRLLAGLEFHYESIVINPLESREPQTGSLIIRDVEKEAAILQVMEESAFAKTDSGYFLHNEELEYEFLYNAVPKLQKLVQIYATTAVRNRVLKEKARPRIRVRMKKERIDWLEFKFEMDGIPEKHIKEILLALEEKRKYYRLRNGSLLSLETREFEEIHRFLNTIPFTA